MGNDYHENGLFRSNSGLADFIIFLVFDIIYKYNILIFK